ncbi:MULTISPECIES: DUF1403 family protein [Roseobacteraceae]|uniref:DUF1403 family protein n=1 Tax=Roseobacteraceae TaxID=2854170 RepID=UPI003298009E
MKIAQPRLSIAADSLPRMPSWVTSGRAETPETVAFLSGAALSHLHLVLAQADVPQALLRARLALRAAERAMARTGRPERAADLRDAVQFLQPGALPGPAGDTYLSWRRAVQRPVSITALHRALPACAPDQIASWLDAGTGAPIARAAQVLETVLADTPRAEVPGLILADAALSQALGWRNAVPLLSTGLKRTDLRKRGADLRLACHHAVKTSAVEITRLAIDLARRVAHLNAVAPKLRAKGARAGVEMFLTLDAVTPAALVSLNSDRAARRFCDRLIDLGAVRELSGRDTFRLYGV